VTVWWIRHHHIQYIKNCWVILLSNYNIKYICTIYTHLDTCLISISRSSLCDKVTLRLLRLYFYIADVAEWSRALDIRLSDWCCSVAMVWVQIPSREEQKICQLKDLILTVFGLIFKRIYIFKYIKILLLKQNRPNWRFFHKNKRISPTKDSTSCY
jgi:hypothetical protein